MTPDQWLDVKTVVAQAVQLDEPAQERLIREIGPTDDTLRHELLDIVRDYNRATVRLSRVGPILTWADTIEATPSDPTPPEPTIRLQQPFAQPALRLEPGDMCGRFRVIKRLGAGGMGQVYLAQDTELQTRVALKILSDQWLDSSEARVRLRREARRAAELRGHPHLALLLDFLEVELKRMRFPVIVMEYVEGEAASALLEAGPVRVTRALRWAIQIADAIGFAHDKGILHCDLKPANIQVTPEDQIKVLDFGVARAMYDEFDSRDVLAGTPAYMSPEQLTERKFTEAGDIYSLGITLFELVTGRHPFSANNLKDMILDVVGSPIPKASNLQPGLPAELDTVLEKATAKDVRHRYQSARELSEDLQNVLYKLDPSALPGVPAVSGRTWLTWAGIGVGAILGIILLGYIASTALDLGLGRKGTFKIESPLLWPVWGLKTLAAPVITLSFWCITLALLGTLAKLVLSIGPLNRLGAPIGIILNRGRQTILSMPDNALAQVLLLVQVGMLVGIGSHFYPLLLALKTFVIPAQAGSLSELRPSNWAMHNQLREFLSLDLLFFGTACYWLLRKKLARRRVIFAAGTATGILTLFLFSMSFRVLYHNQHEKVLYGSEACYLVATRETDILLFCPSRLPRDLTISANDPNLIRTGVTEDIFSEFDRVR